MLRDVHSIVAVLARTIWNGQPICKHNPYISIHLDTYQLSALMYTHLHMSRQKYTGVHCCGASEDLYRVVVVVRGGELIQQ